MYYHHCRYRQSKVVWTFQKTFAALIQQKYPGPLEGEGAPSGAFVLNSNSPDGPLCALYNMRQWTQRDRKHPVSVSPTWWHRKWNCVSCKHLLKRLCVSNPFTWFWIVSRHNIISLYLPPSVCIASRQDLSVSSRHRRVQWRSAVLPVHFLVIGICMRHTASQGTKRTPAWVNTKCNTSSR